jgi:hypothetical protein
MANICGLDAQFHPLKDHRIVPIERNKCDVWIGLLLEKSWFRFPTINMNLKLSV